jgi:hypothetical protein
MYGSDLGKICLSSLQFAKIMREQSAAKPRLDNFHPVKSLKIFNLQNYEVYTKTCSVDQHLLQKFVFYV